MSISFKAYDKDINSNTLNYNNKRHVQTIDT
jgi:hypothetical protein